MSLPTDQMLNRIIEQSLAEDLSTDGDITSKAIFSQEDRCRAVIRSKADGVLAGSYLLEPLFKRIDPDIGVEVLASDGDPLMPGGEICRLDGAIRSILAGERVALNFLQRLSGVATHTDRLVRLLEGTRVRILDTRKTTPLLRMLEKKAVLAGGGANHRFGLFDMILIKDTHVKAAGGPGAAVRKARHYRRDRRKDIPIEVEVQSVDEFKEAMAAGPDRVMLDNMSCDQMRQCVNLAGNYDGSVELEASGNITAETVRDVAETGVDFISVGSLTHSVCAIDIHLVIL